MKKAVDKMVTAQDDILFERIIDQYPTPIAQACKKLFDCRNNISPGMVDEVFNSIWFFAGSVAAAQYILMEAPSLKINLFLMSSIRFINCEKWIKAFEMMIPEFIGKDFMMPFLMLYRTAFAAPGNILEKYQAFRKRMRITSLPVDNIEVYKIYQEVLNLLESISFLKDYTLFTCDNTGSFYLKGLEKIRIEEKSGLSPGQVVLMNAKTGESLSLNPFVKPSENALGIVYTDFKQDQESYKEIIKTPSFLRDIREYQNLLAARPVFDKNEKQLPLLISFDDIKDTLEKALLTSDIRRILLESPPGGGKTLLTANLRQIINKPDLYIADYYLEQDHLTTSIAIFSRFFYYTINDCLGNPYEFSGRKEEWKEFRDKIMRDFLKSGKNLVFVIDSIGSALLPFPGEKVSIEQFLNMEIPNNVKIVMTTRTGVYPESFDSRIQIPPVDTEQLINNTDKGISAEKISKLCEFYGGQRGYINRVLQENVEDPVKIPDSIARQFNELIFSYGYFDPVKGQVFRYLSRIKEPVTLQKISMDLEISGFEIMNLLSGIWPLVKFESSDTVRYALFIPAFAKFIQDYDNNDSF
jgi:hypothetical protein